MKRAALILGVAGLAAFVTFLITSRNVALERAERLDQALADAEARLQQLGADLETANQRLASFEQSQNSGLSSVKITAPRRSAPPASPPVPDLRPNDTPNAAGSGFYGGVTEVDSGRPEPAVGPVIRYTAVASSEGVTNRVRIEGTSSMHPWQVESPLIGGTAEFGADFPPKTGAKPTAGPVDAQVSVFIPVKALKSITPDGSPYSDAMDDLMYEKLRVRDYPRITFTLNRLTRIPSRTDPAKRSSAAEPLLYQAVGALALAGRTNSISMPVMVSLGADRRMMFSGSVKVKMTDFNIDPVNIAPVGIPIKVGDEVTLKFSWGVGQRNPLASSR